MHAEDFPRDWRPASFATTGARLRRESMTTILVIDDDERLQSLLKSILEEEGYAVVQADNGANGVREYRQMPTDLVLCDLFMDGQDGLQR